MIDLDEILGDIDAVCFGTLVEITDKRRAYAPLFRVLPKDVQKELKQRLLCEPLDLAAWCRQVNAGCRKL